MQSSQEASAASSSQAWRRENESRRSSEGDEENEPEMIRRMLPSNSSDDDNIANVTLPDELLSKVKQLALGDLQSADDEAANMSLPAELLTKVEQLNLVDPENDDDAKHCTIELDSSDVVFVEKVQGNETIVLSSDDEKSPQIVALKHRDSKLLAKKDLTSLADNERSADGGAMDEPDKRLNTILPMTSRDLSIDEQMDTSDVSDSIVNLSFIPGLFTTEQVIKYVPCKANERMPVGDLFDESTGLPRIELLKNHLSRGGLLSIDAALRIIVESAVILRHEPNVVKIDAPVTICANVNGQFDTFMKLLEVGGNPSDVNYLCLGNYVDVSRDEGIKLSSIEIILYMLSLKLNYPSMFHILRGKHECRELTEKLKEECHQRYNIHRIYNACMDAFNCLPLAAVVNNKVLCLHGGLPTMTSTIKDIEMIHRFKETPEKDSLCEILWSEPSKDYGEKTATDQYFLLKKGPQLSYFYSYGAVRSFLVRNQLVGMIRAPEAHDAEYKIFDQKDGRFPSLLTLPSAPSVLRLEILSSIFKSATPETEIRASSCNVKRFQYNI